MNWSDERYVRLYTRDTADWLALSFDAQSLFALLIRKVDRAGVLELGKHGKRAVAIAIGHVALWDRLAPALAELEADGCVAVNGDKLVIRNFIEAQEARQSDRMRQAESRARRRDQASDVTNRDGQSQIVTESHTRSHDVTPSHTTSQPVTPSRTVPSLDPFALSGAQASLLEGIPTPAPDVPRFDFEALYRRYPRKRGKAAGMKLCAKLIRTEADYAALRRAIDTYTHECAGKDAQYVMHWSRFLTTWRDYLEPDKGATPPTAPRTYVPPVVAAPIAPDAVRAAAADLVARLRKNGS